MSTRWMTTVAAPLLAALAVGLASSAAADASRLWGQEGEQWDPRGRLPDFSYAGYRAGREPIPDVPVANDVRDFGAVGDGETDDTAAFRAAVEATEEGAILIPAGRYLIRDILTIERDGVVLRGEGPTESVLYIDRSLTDLNGGVREQRFSYGGGFLVMHRPTSNETIGAIVAPAERGDRWLEVERVEGLEPGDLVIVRQVEADGESSLGRHMHNEQEDASRCGDVRVQFNWRARVASVDVEESRVELEDPLPIDVRLAWGPVLQEHHYLRETGIEGIGIEFPSTPYPGHLNEDGYNAILARSVFDAWIRDVHITNADSGIFAGGKNITIEDVHFFSERPPDGTGNQGHHGVGSGQSGLFQRLHFEARFTHSITVSNQAARNVFADVGGTVPIHLDHHRRTPMENLFTGFTSSSDYRSGGNGCEGPHAGARNTYWGLAGPVEEPCAAATASRCWGHIQSNVVGDLAMGDMRTAEREWYENVSSLEPGNLYEAMLARRNAIEDRAARFSPLRFGLRSDWDEHDSSRWAVVERDGDARYVLYTTIFSQKEGDRMGEYALAQTPALGDVTVTARASSPEALDARYRDVCLVLGFQDDENYDYAMFNADPASTAIFAVRDGQREELANAGRAILTDRAWHTVAFRREGARLEMRFDGEVIAAAEDAPAPLPGRVGVGTFNDWAFFDDVEIASPDLPDEVPDAGPGARDGGGGGDGGQRVDGGVAAPAGSGCGCRGAGGAGEALPLGVGASLLLLVGLRRRRPRR